MPLGLYADAPEHVTCREYDDPPLQAGQVRLRAELASIKHGTMFHVFSGRSPFQKRRLDPNSRLFVPDESQGAPMVGRFIGHMVVGTVAQVGSQAKRFRPGDRVYAYGPACETVTLPEDAPRALEPPMTDLDAVCTDPALFAYAALRDARVRLGDNVAVFGLVAIGQFLVQMLRRAGCLHVVAVDPLGKRRDRAAAGGADAVLDPTACDVAVAVREWLGAAADLAIEASGHYAALAEAIRSVRQCGRVITLGYYSGRDSRLELGAEYFHNRLELIASLPDWHNPSREHPLWDKPRLEQAVLDFFRRRWLDSEGVVDPIVGFADSAGAFLRIYRDPSEAIKLGIRFAQP